MWYNSKDGTRVPMFIVKHKDTKFDGTAPALQYGQSPPFICSFDLTMFAFLGYGGFTIPINPFFSPAILTVLQKYRAVLAVPNIRGGSEFGEDWHRGGMLDKKVRRGLPFERYEKSELTLDGCASTFTDKLL